MSGYFIFNEQRLSAYLFYACCAMLIMLPSGCGNDTSTPSTPDQVTSDGAEGGSASFNIEWHTDSKALGPNNATHVRAAKIACADVGVENINCIVYDELNNPIARGGPWACEDGSGIIDRIIAGPGRRFSIIGWKTHEGNIIYQGHTPFGTEIIPGEIAEVGTIDALPFVPTLNAPADGETVSANSVSFNWSSLPNASGYNLMVSEDDLFSTKVIDEVTDQTSYTPADLKELTTYYWMVRAIDPFNNEGATSAAYRFTTGQTVACRPPVLDSVDSQKIDENQPLTFTLTAQDPDGGGLNYKLSDLPSGATFDETSHTFSWTPAFGDEGNYTVTATVCDNCQDGPLCDSKEINIAVGDVCRRPNLEKPKDEEVKEGDTLSFTLKATDPDGSKLKYSASSLPDGAKFDEANQNFTWATGFGDDGNYTVTFTVCDDCPTEPLCDTEKMNIDVGDVCRRPDLADPGDHKVDEGKDLSFTLNTSDPDGGKLTITHSTLPKGATYNAKERTFNWKPDFGAQGNYEVNFTVCDDCPTGPLCDTENTKIAVGNVCRAPDLKNPGNQKTDENKALSFTLDATDPDGDPLSLTHDTLPPGANFDPDQRTFNWTPGFGDQGNYEVTFTACDNCPQGALCDTEKIKIAVGDVCRTPELTSPGDSSVVEEQTLSFTLNAKDPDGDPLTYSATGLPPEAVVDPKTGGFSWTPKDGDNGVHKATFTACDNCNTPSPRCDSKDVSITVLDKIGIPAWIVPKGNSPEPMDNNCGDRSDTIEWTFQWSNIPDATQYNINVFRPGTIKPFIDGRVEGTTYTYKSEDVISDSDRLGWSCKVRAGTGEPRWGEWSELQPFDVEKLNTDCPIIPCSQTTKAGNNKAETFFVEMGKSSGEFDFRYQTYTVPDEIIVSHGNEQLFTTECKGTSGTVTLKLKEGEGNRVKVQVIPNCNQTKNTAWNFTVSCPK